MPTGFFSMYSLTLAMAMADRSVGAMVERDRFADSKNARLPILRAEKIFL